MVHYVLCSVSVGALKVHYFLCSASVGALKVHYVICSASVGALMVHYVLCSASVGALTVHCVGRMEHLFHKTPSYFKHAIVVYITHFQFDCVSE